MKHIISLSLTLILLIGCFPSTQQQNQNKTGYYVIAQYTLYDNMQVFDTHSKGGVSEERILIDKANKSIKILPEKYRQGELPIQINNVISCNNRLIKGLQVLAKSGADPNGSVQILITGYEGIDIDRGKTIIVVCAEKSTSSDKILSIAVSIMNNEGSRLGIQYTLDPQKLPDNSGRLF